MNDLISVIVTVHNSEKYISECLDSLMSQTYSDIEILCVDGGSIDSTPTILIDYADRDSRIRIINDSNTSYGHKINVGIEKSYGKYISVLESDDYYDSTMLEKLYGIASKYDTDIVNSNYISFYSIMGKKVTKLIHMYEPDEYDRLIIADKYSKLSNITRYWTGLFKRDFLLRCNIRMNESPGASYQDMSFRFLTSILAKSVYHLNEALYWYRVDNPESSMHDSAKSIMIMGEHEYLRNELTKRNILEDIIWHEEIDWKYRDFFGNMAYINTPGPNRDNFFDMYLKELENDRELIEKYRLNGYCDETTMMITLPPDEMKRKIEECSQLAIENKVNEGKLIHSIIQWNNTIVICGSGMRGRGALEKISSIGCNDIILTDNSPRKIGSKLGTYTIRSTEEVAKAMPEALYVIANKNYCKEIRAQLLDLGILEKNITLFY